MKLLQSFTILLIIIPNINCARILGIFNIPSKSHHILGECLLKGLAAKGHEVTMLSPFSSEKLPKNYNEIVLENVFQVKDEMMSRMMLDAQNSSLINKIITTMQFMNVMEDIFFNHTKIYNLIHSEDRYDLAIVMWFGNDAILALAEHMAKHTVIFSTIGSNFEPTKLTKAPAPSSYVPNLFPHFPDEMNLFERFLNLLTSISYVFIDYIFMYQQRIIINKYLPNSPSTYDLYEHVSLILLNTHFSLESPRPYVPQMIQVGGLQLEESKNLTGELKQFMDEASEGVILFSMGSNIKSSDIDKQKLNGIINCFARLPYKVLWKFEKEDFPSLPTNIKITKWLPQKDLLAHKNIKLFITHGGLLSVTEAIYNGVPMIGIPIFGDQERNVHEGKTKGYMVHVSYSDLTEETLSSAIEEVLHNPTYRNNIQARSRVFRDQPLKPLDKAVYWIEYVIRHDGAHHLKTSAFKLYWFQLYLLDVIAIIFVVIFVFICIARKIFKCLCKCLCKKSSQHTAKKLKKKSKLA